MKFEHIKEIFDKFDYNKNKLKILYFILNIPTKYTFFIIW